MNKWRPGDKPCEQCGADTYVEKEESHLGDPIFWRYCVGCDELVESCSTCEREPDVREVDRV